MSARNWVILKVRTQFHHPGRHNELLGWIDRLIAAGSRGPGTATSSDSWATTAHVTIIV